MDYGQNQTRNNQINLFLIEATKNAAQKWPQLMVTIRLLLVARANCRQACSGLEMFYIAGFFLSAIRVGQRPIFSIAGSLMHPLARCGQSINLAPYLHLHSLVRKGHYNPCGWLLRHEPVGDFWRVIMSPVETSWTQPGLSNYD